MNDILEQRCFRHEQREAVAVCPECRRFFCRECITEHDDRVLCAECLHALTAYKSNGSIPFKAMLKLGAAFFSFLLVWLFFFAMGRMLLSIPSSFHEGTFWAK